MAWSPDGTHLATAGGDKTVRIWDPATGQTTTTLTGHTRGVNTVAWSPDGTHLATTGGLVGEPVRIWSLATGQRRRLRRLLGRRADIVPAPVGSIRARTTVWSPDGAHLAAGGRDGAVSLSDPITGGLTATVAGHSPVSAMAFFPDGDHLAVLRSDFEVSLLTPDQSDAGTRAPCRLKLASGLGLAIAGDHVAVYGSAGITMLRWIAQSDRTK